MAGMDIHVLSRRTRWLGLALVITVTLASCGGDEANEEAEGNTGGNIASPVIGNIPDASPQPGSVSRGNMPQDATSETVAIKDGKLDPDNIESQVGQPFILVVEGDGSPHTLEIEGIVAGEEIPANQTKEVSFTVPQQQTGTVKILLDGKEAGSFEIQGASGGTNP